MDNFEKDILSSMENTHDSENSEFLQFEMLNSEESTSSKQQNSRNSDLADTMTKSIIVCFPRTRIEGIEVYFRSRNINDYDTVFDIFELDETLKSTSGVVNVYLFDFIGEPRIRNVFISNKLKISNLVIFTDKENIAEIGSELTDEVFLISQLIDILTLFWDSNVFSYKNVLNAKENGIELVNKRALEIQGKKLDRLDLSLAVENEKPNKYSEPVSYINIEKKFQGKDIGRVKSGNFFKRTIDNLFGKVKEEIFEEEYDESEKLSDEDNVYRLENPKLTRLVSKLQTTIESTMSSYLLEKGIITEEIKNQIDTLKDLKQISGMFCEVDFAISKGLIDEVTSINLINDYYLMYCMQFEDVLNCTVLLDEFKFEGCLEYKCFCIRGMRRDVNYFVIDPDNEYGKHKIEEMFNDFEYIYTKERYIMEKLHRMEVR